MRIQESADLLLIDAEPTQKATLNVVNLTPEQKKRVLEIVAKAEAK